MFTAARLRQIAFVLVLISGAPCSTQFLQARPQHIPGQRKVGLVLSGGGARGAAHIGVLKVLEREQIPIDCIAGTSFGALVGGLYAVGYNAADIERIFASANWNSMFTTAPERRLSALNDLNTFRHQVQINFHGFVPDLPTGLSNGQKITEVLDTLTTAEMLAVDYDFDRLRIPFRAVATNLLDGTAYVFRRGSMAEALRASIAIPMLFTPVDKDGMLLVDGGLADNVPSDVAKQMGADVVIAVDVSSRLMKKDEVKNFFDVMDQSMSLLENDNARRNLAMSDLVLRPNLDGYTYNDYGSFAKIIKLGEEEAARQVAALRQATTGLPRKAAPPPFAAGAPKIIAGVRFEGLRTISSVQLAGEVKARAGQTLDPKVLGSDLSRLYATRLFDRADYALTPADDNRVQVVYQLTEAPSNTLGASIRYDLDYSFVALAEFTARQLFHTPSTFVFSNQFGGLEDHTASLHYVYPRIPFLFIEPRVFYRTRERLDIRDMQLVDKFTDRRVGGEMMFGGTIGERIALAAGYSDERVSIGGGAPPRRLDGYQRLAGLTFRLNRDTLDAQEFPHAGTVVGFRVDQRKQALGSDLTFSKWQADFQHFLSPSAATTVAFQGSAGYSHGDVPFYDQYFVGGYNFSAEASRHLVGFKRDELVGRQMAIAGLRYRCQVFARPLSFIRRGFVTGVYNAAGISQGTASPASFKVYHGAGIGFAADSLIGPIRIVAGWGTSGRFNMYLTIGPSF
jgi:NTE family protein